MIQFIFHVKSKGCSQYAMTKNSYIWYIFVMIKSVITFSLVSVNNGATLNQREHFSWNNYTGLQALPMVDSNVDKGVFIKDFHAASAVTLSEAKTESNCPHTTSSHCLRCNSEGCVKCPAYLVTDTRQCVERCPSGYIDQWSAHTEFMGRICIPTGYSGPLMAALAGLFGGFLVCLSFLTITIIFLRRRRRRKAIKAKLINENIMDRADFLQQLNGLRPNAEYFLAMLNDTRRQIRKLYLSGDLSGANSYRPIVRDLAKILILLNRPIELIPTPSYHDWNRLYAWSEQVLERYKPRVGQLIDFLQPRQSIGEHGFNTPVPYSDRIFRKFSNKSTTLGNSEHKFQVFGSLISLHEFEEPHTSDPFGSSFNTLKNGHLISDLNASSLWLEDEFYKLGFRPQDEITTEL